MNIKHLVFYCGPNRRSDKTLIEILLEFTADDLRAIAAATGTTPARLTAGLREAGVEVPENAALDAQLSADPRVIFGEWCCAIALLLQRSAGHDVHDHSVLPDEQRPRCALLFEHEESRVGERAGQLALELVSAAVPGLDDPQPAAEEGGFSARLADFRQFARQLVQPADTRAIIEAARRADIPVIKLERDPYEPVQGDFRIRMNSMLMLGHSAQRQLLDGTFALEKSAPAAGLLFDRSPAMQALARSGLPVPRSDRAHRPCHSLVSAQRAAQDTGYPVAVKPARRRHGQDVTPHVPDPESLAEAYDRAARTGSGVIIEASLRGDSYRLLVANHCLIGVTDGAGARVDRHRVHGSIRSGVEDLSRLLNVGLMTVSIVTPDPQRPLREAGGAAVDVEVAPRLDRVAAQDPGLLSDAATGFIRWLFPPGTRSRIPVIAITGTNGKTTTSRMIAAITESAGYATGLVCTDGRYLDGRLLEAGDQASFMGHYRVFESKESGIAVFETHHRGMAAYGFSFDHCDVAVCTNVSDDHIGEFGLDSVAEMAELKRSLLERAARAVVLNADDEHCTAMLPYLECPRICFTSLASDSAGLRGRFGDQTCACTVEPHAGAEWIAITDAGRVIPVMAVRDIPATFDGLARFNVANALAAIAAAHCMGIERAVTARALKAFATDFERAPWRMNEFHGLPFRVIVDFAHNPDGVRQVAEFARLAEVAGRRTLVFSSWKSDDFIRGVAAAAAGSFDRYVLKCYTPIPGYPEEYTRQPDQVLGLMRATLLERGVGKESIAAIGDEKEAIRHALDTAREGDLVIILVGYQSLKFVRGILEQYLASTA